MKFDKVISNNLIDHLIISDFDYDKFKDIELCLGIDEAGRGPVLGPMVYSALFCPLGQEQKLKEMECADSKTLTEKDREKIFDKINQNNDFCGYATKVLSPNTISNSMLRKVKYNLNELSHDTAISLIDKLYNDKKLNIVQVFLDTVGDPNKYEQKLSKIFPKLKIKVSKKADSLYPCVSAASICAKVTRDYCITHWNCSENMTISNYGSGYPGDPLTKKFLDSNLNPVFGFIKFVRFSWSTSAVKVKKSCVPVKWADLDEENDDDLGNEGSENEGDEDAAKKKEQVKRAPKNAKTKLSMATANEKNNSSLLNFFQKSAQKRSLSSLSNTADLVSSHFLTNRNLKFCAVF